MSPCRNLSALYLLFSHFKICLNIWKDLLYFILATEWEDTELMNLRSDSKGQRALQKLCFWYSQVTLCHLTGDVFSTLDYTFTSNICTVNKTHSKLQVLVDLSSGYSIPQCHARLLLAFWVLSICLASSIPILFSIAYSS